MRQRAKMESDDCAVPLATNVDSNPRKEQKHTLQILKSEWFLRSYDRM